MSPVTSRWLSVDSIELSRRCRSRCRCSGSYRHVTRLRNWYCSSAEPDGVANPERLQARLTITGSRTGSTYGCPSAAAVRRLEIRCRRSQGLYISSCLSRSQPSSRTRGQGHLSPQHCSRWATKAGSSRYVLWGLLPCLEPLLGVLADTSSHHPSPTHRPF